MGAIEVDEKWSDALAYGEGGEYGSSKDRDGHWGILRFDGKRCLLAKVDAFEARYERVTFRLGGDCVP